MLTAGEKLIERGRREGVRLERRAMLLKLLGGRFGDAPADVV